MMALPSLEIFRKDEEGRVDAWFSYILQGVLSVL